MKTKTNVSERQPEVRECVCIHPFQDNRYGRSMRLMNPCKIQNRPGFRCTVCGREHEVSR